MTYLIDVFLHLDMYLDTVIQQYGVWMYFILFVVVFLETGVVVTPFLPGDSLLFAAGALCARGDLAVGWLFLLLWLAAVLGDTVNYSIGHLVGPRARTVSSSVSIWTGHINSTSAMGEGRLCSLASSPSYAPLRPLWPALVVCLMGDL
jgi:membrane protein DedA with SNARE-associated domain